jgi:hypothetical protein
LRLSERFVGPTLRARNLGDYAAVFTIKASAAVEQKVFGNFVGILPNFAGRAVTSAPGPNPPDFMCVDSVGVRIGVELSEWLHEDQIARERPAYRREREFLSVIDSRNVPPPKNIGNLWIFGRERIRLNPSDASQFRSQLYALIAHLDVNWS